MVKLVVINRRRPELSAEEFRAHWQGPHADLVKSLAETVRIRRYVQSPILATPMNAEFAAARGMAADDLPDGISEAWYDSIEDMRAGFSGEAGERAARLLQEDERKFVDLVGTIAFMTEERVVVG